MQRARKQLEAAGLFDTENKSISTLPVLQVIFRTKNVGRVRQLHKGEKNLPAWMTKGGWENQLKVILGQLRKGTTPPIDYKQVYLVCCTGDWKIKKALCPPHAPDAIAANSYGCSKPDHICPYCDYITNNTDTFLGHVAGDHYRCAFACALCTEKPDKKGSTVIPAWRDPSHFPSHFRDFHPEFHKRDFVPKKDLPECIRAKLTSSSSDQKTTLTADPKKTSEKPTPTAPASKQQTTASTSSKDTKREAPKDTPKKASNPEKKTASEGKEGKESKEGTRSSHHGRKHSSHRHRDDDKSKRHHGKSHRGDRGKKKSKKEKK